MTRRTDSKEYRKEVYKTRIDYNRYVRGLILTSVMLNNKHHHMTRRRIRIDKELLIRYRLIRQLNLSKTFN